MLTEQGSLYKIQVRFNRPNSLQAKAIFLIFLGTLTPYRVAIAQDSDPLSGYRMFGSEANRPPAGGDETLPQGQLPNSRPLPNSETQATERSESLGSLIDEVKRRSTSNDALKTSEQAGKSGVAPAPLLPGTVTFQPPADPRFDEYRKWFREQAIINLVVSGNDRKSLVEALLKLQELRAKRGISVGQIIVVGGPKELIYRELLGLMMVPTMDTFSFAQFESMVNRPNKEIKNILSDLDFDSEPQAVGFDILDKLGLTYSPAWIIRYKGQHYIYEGRIDPVTLFDEQGHFQEKGNW